MIGLDQVATVLVPDAVTHKYTAVHNPALACRLALVAPDTQKENPERAVLASERRLLWDPDYQMPENARVSVDGVTWAMVPGSFAAVRGPTSVLVYRRADAVRDG